MKEVEQIVSAIDQLNKATSDLADKLIEIRTEIVKQMPGETALLAKFDLTIAKLKSLSDEGPILDVMPNVEMGDSTKEWGRVDQNSADAAKDWGGVEIKDGVEITHNELPELG